MVNCKYRERLDLFRTLLSIMLTKHEETEEVYAYFYKDSPQIILFSLNKNEDFLKMNCMKVYKTTLKALYLYCLKEEYNEISWDILVLLANQGLRRYTSEEMARLLKVPLEKYRNLTEGKYIFKDDFSYETISNKLGFNINEFYFNFNDNFTLVELVKEG